MGKNDREQLVGILKQFDQETIMAVITDMGIMNSSLTSFQSPGIFFVPANLMVSGGAHVAASVRKSTDCGPPSVEVTKDGTPINASIPTAESDADKSAIEKARKAAQASCQGDCKENQKCKYTENSITLTTRWETQNQNGQQVEVVISTATTKGACGCE